MISKGLLSGKHPSLNSDRRRGLVGSILLLQSLDAFFDGNRDGNDRIHQRPQAAMDGPGRCAQSLLRPLPKQ